MAESGYGWRVFCRKVMKAASRAGLLRILSSRAVRAAIVMVLLSYI